MVMAANDQGGTVRTTGPRRVAALRSLARRPPSPDRDPHPMLRPTVFVPVRRGDMTNTNVVARKV